MHVCMYVCVSVWQSTKTTWGTVGLRQNPAGSTILGFGDNHYSKLWKTLCDNLLEHEQKIKVTVGCHVQNIELLSSS